MEWAGEAHFFFYALFVMSVVAWAARFGSGSQVGPVQAVIERAVSAMGYELVDLEIAGRGLLRVFIDRPPLEGGLTEGAPPVDAGSAGSAPLIEPGSEIRIRVEDCERVSHQLSHVLTVENIDYARLEVSSPGMDRPLRRSADYERFQGAEVSVRLRVPLAGRRNFEGVLLRDEQESGRWLLELTERPPTDQKKPGGKSGKGVRGARATAGRGAGSAPGVKRAPDAVPDSGIETVRRLSFTLDEVERARLVPKFKF